MRLIQRRVKAKQSVQAENRNLDVSKNVQAELLESAKQSQRNSTA